MIYLIDKESKRVVGSVSGRPNHTELAKQNMIAVESDLNVSPRHVTAVRTGDTFAVVETPLMELEVDVDGSTVVVVTTVRNPQRQVLENTEGNVRLTFRSVDETITVSAPLEHGRAETVCELHTFGDHTVEASHPEYASSSVQFYVSKQ